MNEKKKLRIGIDLDDVIFEFARPFLEIANEKYNKNMLFEDLKTFSFLDLFNISLEEFEILMGKFEKKFFMNEEILLEDAKKSILNLAEDNEIFFITSRISLKERTEEQIRTLLGDFDFNLHFSSNSYAKTSGKTKDEICAELGIDFMIEDDFGYATKCAEKGIKSFLIDKPWNQDCVYENIIRVKDWNEILENFNELKNGD